MKCAPALLPAFCLALCLALCLLPGAGRADPPQTSASLAARAAALAQGEAAAASSIRGMENQTVQDSTQLANLQAAQADQTQRLAAAQVALAKLLPVMQRLARAPAATLLAAPLKPGDAVRGIALLQGVASAIAAQAQTVQTENAELALLIEAAQQSKTRLTQAAATQAAAESALSAQIKAGMAVQEAAADPLAAQKARQMAAQNRLDNLSDAVSSLVPQAAQPSTVPQAAQPSTVPQAAQPNPPWQAGGQPVAGRVIQAFGTPTLAGPATGVLYGAAPGAHVTSPCAGTVMFAGPFPAYGLMIITDCGHGASVVLAGMTALDVVQGEHLTLGQPVGTMQDFDPAMPAHQPRLYMELRQNGTPVDPSAWLHANRSG